MPNPKHLAKLSKGAELWNQFRRRHPDLIPDLSGVKLPQVDLGGADLSKANLREAELGGWFSHASFVNADLTHAVFEDSEFAFADLRNANLCRCASPKSRNVQIELRRDYFQRMGAVRRVSRRSSGGDYAQF
jgi:uncharacterized protein YjbI with pentapeptide repeats